MALGAGKAMMTLDVRESKSSLAGVMMAAAMEGVGIYQFTENVLPHLEELPGQIADVLSRIDLPALPGFLKKPVAAGDTLPTPAGPAGGDSALGGVGSDGVSVSAGGGPPAAAAALPETPAGGAATKDAAAKVLDKAGQAKDAGG